MKKITRIAAGFLAVLFSMFAMAACQPTQEGEQGNPETGDWEYIRSKGQIVIGITEFAPMNYNEDGKLTGFDTELAEAICAQLGITAKFQVINWNAKETELSAKTVDCLWNGFTVNNERRQNMAFTDSYMKNDQVIVIRKSDAEQYTTTASLSGARLVAEDGSSGADAIAANADLSKATYTPVDGLTTALIEVKSGTADAAIVDSVLAYFNLARDGSYQDLMIIPNTVVGTEEYAVGFRKGSDAAEVFTNAMKTLAENGTLATLAAKYDLTDSLLLGKPNSAE